VCRWTLQGLSKREGMRVAGCELRVARGFSFWAGCDREAMCVICGRGGEDVGVDESMEV